MTDNVVHAAVWRYAARDKTERMEYVYVLGDKQAAQVAANSAGGYLRFGDSYEFPPNVSIRPDKLLPFPHCKDDTDAIWLELVNPAEWRRIETHGYPE